MRQIVKCTVSTEGGIALVSFSGFVWDRPAIRQARDALLAHVPRTTRVLVTECQHLRVRCASDLNTLFDEPDPRLEIPAALIVAPHELPIWRQHAWDAAQAGVMRKVFTCQGSAWRWARGRLALVSG